MICTNSDKSPDIYGPYRSNWDNYLLFLILPPDGKMDQFSENLFSKKFKDKGRALR